ncbi:unnamed protein product [Protopolystoma xenopodis]|uniref:Ig-like domain-containing protein n=1 Tax=Protopolystoma xenopodis TaxID=117903 RepID=A0A448X1J8_9PLAT|nr:unnamed protein product [Protopolystoma xenopodis]
MITGSEGANPRPVVNGLSTRFNCDWDASPSATVEWSKDGEQILVVGSGSRARNVTTLDSQVIRVEYLLFSDACFEAYSK